MNTLTHARRAIGALIAVCAFSLGLSLTTAPAAQAATHASSSRLVSGLHRTVDERSTVGRLLAQLEVSETCERSHGPATFRGRHRFSRCAQSMPAGASERSFVQALGAPVRWTRRRF